jgi:ATP-dependent RNA helicase DDX56/DBP9
MSFRTTIPPFDSLWVSLFAKKIRVKLFLERFSIKSAVLNSELPQNSRYHAVQQFNKGVFDLLIASDENVKGEAEDDDDEDVDDEESGGDVEGDEEMPDAADDDEEEEEDGENDDDEADEDEDEDESEEEEDEKKSKKQTKVAPKKKQQQQKSNKKGRRADDEYGVARGMDFQNVSAGSFPVCAGGWARSSVWVA